jgi:DNA gyrase inhibitor GyrI
MTRGGRAGKFIRKGHHFGHVVGVKKMWVLLFILAGVVAVIIVGCQATRAGYETAPYKRERTDGKFELRDYPALTVAETPMPRGGNEADGSFSRLFRFIAGGNETKEKIAMTTPVFMSGSDSNATMAFVLPAKLSGATAPQPADSAVTVREVPGGKFAVLRFSGGRSPEHEAGQLARLQTWLAAQGLKTSGPAIYAYFDPPWTPAFLRRNEVMLRVTVE